MNMKNTINWSYFPKTDPTPEELERIIDVFEKNFKEIDTIKDEEKIDKGLKKKQDRLQSDDILKFLENDFLDLNFKIETDKKKTSKIRVPVLFGHQSKTTQAFEVDGWHEENKVVLEIERGRAFANYQFLKDIFEASVMVNVDYLVLAVSNLYLGSNDFEKICVWLETIYATNRIKLSLKGILLVGY